MPRLVKSANFNLAMLYLLEPPKLLTHKKPKNLSSPRGNAESYLEHEADAEFTRQLWLTFTKALVILGINLYLNNLTLYFICRSQLIIHLHLSTVTDAKRLESLTQFDWQHNCYVL
jgi:hypothetical protein